MKLTKRDIQVLKLVNDFRFALTTHIIWIVFNGSKSGKRRLKLLTDSGFLYHIQHLSSLKGRAEYLYYLSLKSCRYLNIPRNKVIINPAHKELPHTLLINDFIFYLILACEKKRLKFYHIRGDSFLREERQFAEFLKTSGFHKPMYPDIVFSLENRDGKKALFFVEVERQTFSIESKQRASLQKKINTMAGYFDNNVFNFFNDLFEYNFNGFRYLLITTGNKKRINKIISTCYDPELDLDFVWLACFSALSEANILNRVWQKLNINDKTPYSLIN